MSHSKDFLDVHQTVGYKSDDETLVVTLTAKMANQMKKDGWVVDFNAEIGHYITIKKE